MDRTDQVQTSHASQLWTGPDPMHGAMRGHATGVGNAVVERRPFMSMSRKYALMWSGGKDSALALNRAHSRGLNIVRLINFYEASTGRVRFHATAVAMVEAQAAAIGIPLVAIGTTWEQTEAR